jgi:arsenate reductase
MTVTIYHNPKCGTSRNTLGLIRNAGIEPTIVEYLKNPPSRTTLADLIARAGITVTEAVRQKEATYAELGLNRPDVTDDTLLDAMIAHPLLINRPFVVAAGGVRLCRPSEVVLDILIETQRGPFTKEDGERVVDDNGKRVTND